MVARRNCAGGGWGWKYPIPVAGMHQRHSSSVGSFTVTRGPWRPACLSASATRSICQFSSLRRDTSSSRRFPRPPPPLTLWAFTAMPRRCREKFRGECQPRAEADLRASCVNVNQKVKWDFNPDYPLIFILTTGADSVEARGIGRTGVRHVRGVRRNRAADFRVGTNFGIFYSVL